VIWVKHFALRFGIDRAVFFTLLERGWNVGAGLIIIALAAHFFIIRIAGLLLHV